ncbi:MAG: DUF971 domain-containing protein [Candidatus Omnitrophica bacterium]|nr:DUF971 domain-containing protein [Candidatus Omnitrophota bacterium]
MAPSSPAPQRIERFGENSLKILWADGHESLYTWGALRAACPCAACLPSGEAVGPEVRPLSIQPVGRYALNIRWSDGHTTGIFSYEFLRSLCSCEACRPGQFTEG